MSRDSGLGRADFRSSEGRSCLNYGIDTSTLDMRTVSHNRGMATVDVGRPLFLKVPLWKLRKLDISFKRLL